MFAAVADTHAIIWYLYSDPRLSEKAKVTIDTAINSGSAIAISAITIVEMAYLIEKSRIAADSLPRLLAILLDPTSLVQTYPLDLMVARTLSRIDRQQIPDMPDRIIAATGLFLNVPLSAAIRKFPLRRS
ncbi:MAG: PIN domain-containing protein [Chloroflexota bacterium]|nr:PIN domain-containing protein [Chloroflexota bacterium]